MTAIVFHPLLNNAVLLHDLPDLPIAMVHPQTRRRTANEPKEIFITGTVRQSSKEIPSRRTSLYDVSGNDLSFSFPTFYIHMLLRFRATRATFLPAEHFVKSSYIYIFIFKYLSPRFILSVKSQQTVNFSTFRCFPKKKPKYQWDSEPQSQVACKKEVFTTEIRYEHSIMAFHRCFSRYPPAVSPVSARNSREK